jgi:hypothetical protein
LDLRVGDLIDAYIAGSMKYCCFHSETLW